MTIEQGMFSRKDFLKSAGLTGMGLALAGTFAASALAEGSASAASTDETGGTSSKAAQNWDEECEVLVVGSGYAALAAAYEAKNAGADVKVIEKLESFGGNSVTADGDFAVCGSIAQEAYGIEDSVELYVADMLKAGLNLNDVEKCTLIAQKSNETWEWTRDVLGVEWQKDADGNYEPIPYGGHSVWRTLHPTGLGASIVMPLMDALSDMGVEVEMGRMMVALIRNDEGRVVGVTVHDDATDNDVTTGTPKNIHATKAVILGTGGFGRDIAWRMQHDPTLGADVDCTNREGATSESLQAAMRAGALAVHLDWIQLGPWCSPDEKGYGVGPSYIDSNVGYAPSIDPQTGLRIVNELTDRKKYSDAILANGVPLIQVVDKRNTRDWAQEYLQNCLKAGITWEMESLDDIAAKFDIPVDAFKEEMDRYNTYVENGVDEEFGKSIPEDALPVAEPPYYVTRIWPKVHHCMGGLKTDLDGRVLDVSLKPIEGLFAAGEATGGVHGACRLGSCATAESLVCGRIAGQKAAEMDALA